MNADTPPPTGIPTKLTPKQLEEVKARLARVTLLRCELEQVAKDAASVYRKAIKDLKKEQTTLAEEQESGMRLEDRQQDLFDDDDAADEEATPPEPEAPPTTAKKGRGRGKRS